MSLSSFDPESTLTQLRQNRNRLLCAQEDRARRAREGLETALGASLERVREVASWVVADRSSEKTQRALAEAEQEGLAGQFHQTLLLHHQKGIAAQNPGWPSPDRAPEDLSQAMLQGFLYRAAFNKSTPLTSPDLIEICVDSVREAHKSLVDSLDSPLVASVASGTPRELYEVLTSLSSADDEKRVPLLFSDVEAKLARCALALKEEFKRQVVFEGSYVGFRSAEEENKKAPSLNPLKRLFGGR